MIITNISFRQPNHYPTDIQAIATVTFDNAFAVHGIKVIHTRSDDLIVRMPYHIGKNGRRFSTFHPINNEARLDFEDRILDAYENWADMFQKQED